MKNATFLPWCRAGILILLFIIIALNGNSQFSQHVIDSLENALAHHPQKDTTRIDILAWLSVANSNVDPIKGIGNLKEAIEIAGTIKSNRDYGLWVMLGWAYIHIDDYPKSIEAFQEIFKIVSPESEEYAAALHFIGMNYKFQGDWDKALSYTKAGHEMEEKIKANGGKIKDPRTDVGTPWNLGEIYFKKNVLDTALEYGLLAHKVVLTMEPDIQYQFNPAITTLLGNIYIQLAQKDSAKKYLDEANQFFGKSYTSLIINEINLARARWFTQFGSLDSAMWYAKTAYEQAKKSSGFDIMFQSAHTMRLVAEKKRQYDLALKYNDLAIAVKDSMLGVDKIKKTQAMHYDFQLKEQQVVNLRTELRLNNRVKLLGLASFFIGLGGISLFANNQRRKKTIQQLNEQHGVIETQKIQLQTYINELQEKQTQLIHAEKMASLGELTAGIAHEIQNPLNFVNNFSSINAELIDEMTDEIDKGNTNEVKALAKDIADNEQKIIHHGKRAENIVRAMLEHSHLKPGEKTETDINALAEEFLKLSYHAIRAKDKLFNVHLITELDPTIPKLKIIPTDVGRVLINIFNNAFYSMNEKQQKKGASYHPALKIQSKIHDKSVDMIIKDNGLGISKAIQAKIFQPFFTTKPSGNGTGLGLSLSYDIITKAHGGQINVASEEGEYCEIKISLPLGFK